MNVLVVAPHPDDESIGCGGAICLHRRRGDEVTVVFLSSGEGGLTQLSKEIARSVRETEACSAGEILGIKENVFLRVPDSHVSEDIETTASRLASILDRICPELIYLPHAEDGHP